jgi:hypothetical protein
MPEWPKPQSSAHGTSYLPGFVALNQTGIDLPGTASCLRRNCGTKKLWMTSCAWSWTRTTLLTGTWKSLSILTSSSVPSFPSAPG